MLLVMSIQRRFSNVDRGILFML